MLCERDARANANVDIAVERFTRWRFENTTSADLQLFKGMNLPRNHFAWADDSGG